MTRLRAAAARLRGEPDPDGDPRLPRRPRRRARRDLRGPLAGADRGPRHDGRPTSRATTCTRRWRLRLLARLHVPRRRGLRASPRVHRKTRIPQEAIIGIVYAVVGGGVHPGDVQGHAGDRAPEGDAGRQHPLGDLAGARQDGGPLRAGRPLPLRPPQDASSSSPWTSTRPSGAGSNIRFWDFLFYVSFGFVVTSSVRHRRRAARLLLPHRAVRDGHALLAAAGRRASPSAGPWGRSCRRSASTSRTSGTCRPARRSSRPSARGS